MLKNLFPEEQFIKTRRSDEMKVDFSVTVLDYTN